MVQTKEEILKSLKAVIGDSTDDAAISLIENVTDTLDDDAKRITESGDWKSKYEENDKEWREKYTSRFFDPAPAPSGSDVTTTVTTGTETTEDEPETYEDLFKEGE